MDLSLFQFAAGEVADSLIALKRPRAHANSSPARYVSSTLKMEKTKGTSANLDFLRSYAVLLVIGFHLAKFFDWRFQKIRVTDFGLLDVMLFFVHTTLVLMFSLERQSTGSNSSLFVPFMIRRCFRIYPLAILVVTFAFIFRIPSDLRFGGFHLLYQSVSNLIANLFLIQNVTLQKANPGILWSLPLELQMYVALPALFLFASRVKSAWGVIAFWWLVVALWFAAGYSTGMLPLSDGKIRTPVEALLKLTRFVPCFLPGIVAYKLWRLPRLVSAWAWPLFLSLCGVAFMRVSGAHPIETGWLICLVIGLGVCLFREMPENFVTWLTKRIARYSYGIYLLHYFAIWLGFTVCRHFNISFQIAVFLAALLILSISLYHTVEAPLIALGVRYSEKFSSSFGVPEHSAGSGRLATSEPTGSV